MKKVNCWFKAGEIYDCRDAIPGWIILLIQIAGTTIVKSPYESKTRVIYTVLTAKEKPTGAHFIQPGRTPRTGEFWADDWFTKDLVRVFPKDLPLHMDAGWLSREFEKMLKELPHG